MCLYIRINTSHKSHKKMLKNWYGLIYGSMLNQYVHVMENRFTDIKKTKLFKEYYDRCSDTKNFKTFVYINSMYGGHRTINNRIYTTDHVLLNGKEDYKNIRPLINPKFLTNNNPRTLIRKSVLNGMRFNEIIVCMKRKLKPSILRVGWSVYNKNNVQEMDQIVKVKLNYAKKYPKRNMTSELIGDPNENRHLIKFFTGKRGCGDFALSEVTKSKSKSMFMFVSE